MRRKAWIGSAAVSAVVILLFVAAFCQVNHEPNATSVKNRVRLAKLKPGTACSIQSAFRRTGMFKESAINYQGFVAKATDGGILLDAKQRGASTRNSSRWLRQTPYLNRLASNVGIMSEPIDEQVWIPTEQIGSIRVVDDPHPPRVSTLLR